MKFKFEHMSQTQLGELLGVTSHKIGSWLTELGLRENGTPTKKAHDCGYCKQAIAGEKGIITVWHSEKTVAALKEAGHHIKLDPPQSLVHPAILNGPFSVRPTESSVCIIENADGSDCIRVNSKMNADVIAELLNLAHSKGVIDRKCLSQRLMQTTLPPAEVINRIVKPFE